MTEVCHNVCTEPHLQPLSGESLAYSTANTDDEARLDISAPGFWGARHQRAFFDEPKRSIIPGTSVGLSVSKTGMGETKKVRTKNQRS